MQKSRKPTKSLDNKKNKKQYLRLFGEYTLGPGPLENCFFLFFLFLVSSMFFGFLVPPHPKTPVFFLEVFCFFVFPHLPGEGC